MLDLAKSQSLTRRPFAPINSPIDQLSRHHHRVTDKQSQQLSSSASIDPRSRRGCAVLAVGRVSRYCDLSPIANPNLSQVSDLTATIWSVDPASSDRLCASAGIAATPPSPPKLKRAPSQSEVTHPPCYPPPLPLIMSPTLPSFDFAATRGKRSRMASFAPVLPEGLSHLPNMRFLIPRQVRRRWRATKGRLRVGQSPASNVFRLQTSWSPTDTIAALRTHQWSLYDFQYLGLAILGIFCLSIMENPGPMVKTFGATALLLSLVFPVTSQFWLPTLPVVGWIILFFSCRYVTLHKLQPTNLLDPNRFLFVDSSMAHIVHPFTSAFSLP